LKMKRNCHIKLLKNTRLIIVYKLIKDINNKQSETGQHYVRELNASTSLSSR